MGVAAADNEGLPAADNSEGGVGSESGDRVGEGSSGSDDGASGSEGVKRNDGGEEITKGTEQLIVESKAESEIRLPCKFLDKVYSGAYSSTWIVEWEKTGRDGLENGKFCYAIRLFQYV